MKINIENCPLPISRKFVRLLKAEIEKSGVETKHGIIINFKDPDYSAETGGYHPVEVMISESGIIQYVTDFAFAGAPPFAELVKDIDFDFQAGIFEQMGRVYPIEQGGPLFQIFECNFVSYYQMSVFHTKVTALI
ncbi:MAG: DUF2787 family protein [Magnetococcales bacterium]|nr:DUF2787 family protein [Magnetococcales bacterium]